MQDSNSSIGHLRTTLGFFIFNVISVGLIGVSFVFFTHMLWVGMVLVMSAISMSLIGVAWYFKFNGKHLNSFSSVPIIVERVISKTNQPITICRHAVNEKGIVTPQVVFANTAYLDLKNATADEVLGKETSYPQEVSEIDRIKILQAFQDGMPVSAKIVDKDLDGRLYENELYISPMEINGKIAYWIGYRTFIQYLDSNVISLGNQLAKIDQSRLD